MERLRAVVAADGAERPMIGGWRFMALVDLATPDGSDETIFQIAAKPSGNDRQLGLTAIIARSV